VLWSSGFVGFPRPQIKLLPMACAMFAFLHYFPLCPVSGHVPICLPLLCLLLVCASAPFAGTGLIFTQLVDSSNGHWCWCYGQWRAHWCYTQAMLTGSLVDDGLDFWITGGWCSLCLAGTVLVPDSVTFLVFLRNWSLIQSFTMTVSVIVGCPLPTFH